jgi:tight adherence protein C
MNDTTHMILLSSLWAVSIGLIGWYVMELSRQITYVTLADGRRMERSIPLLFKLMIPLCPNLKPITHSAALRKTAEETEKKLVSAGYEGIISGTEFIGVRILFPIIMMMVWMLFIKMASFAAGPLSLLSKIENPLIIIGLCLMVIYPFAWLNNAVVMRHNSVRRSLPFVLDLLTLSVEAGMDFMTALQRNVDKRQLDALGEELLRVTREIQLGKTRRDALREMSKRVDLSELRSVINALVQADELGVSIGSILKIQADQIRQRRFERAEKLANEAPVKMLTPLLLFIFPSVFLILLGPILNKILQSGL